MFTSIVYAVVGVAGAVYSFIMPLLGFYYGPLCKQHDGTWGTPFKESHLKYLTQHETSARCNEPKNVVLFNLGLFIPLMVASGLQGLLRAGQIINGLFGRLCGTCCQVEEA